jgi:hypothetical protein
LFFDIHPTTDWSGGKATVVIHVPDDYNGPWGALTVVHWPSGGGQENIPATASQQYRTITFDTSTFSYFAVATPIPTNTPASSGGSLVLLVLSALGVAAVFARREDRVRVGQ